MVSIGCMGMAALVTMLVYIMFFTLTKEDYRTATRQVNTVIDRYNTLTKQVSLVSRYAIDGGVDEATYTASYTQLKQVAASYTRSVQGLSELAVLDNRDIHGLYDGFTQENRHYMADIEHQQALMPVVRKVTSNCQLQKLSSVAVDLSHIVSAYTTAIRPCDEALQQLSKQDDAAAQQAARECRAYLAAVRSHLEKMERAYTNADRGTFESEYKAYLRQAGRYATAMDVTQVLQPSKHAPEQQLNQFSHGISAKQ